MYANVQVSNTNGSTLEFWYVSQWGQSIYCILIFDVGPTEIESVIWQKVVAWHNSFLANCRKPKGYPITSFHNRPHVQKATTWANSVLPSDLHQACMQIIKYFARLFFALNEENWMVLDWSLLSSVLDACHAFPFVYIIIVTDTTADWNVVCN